MNEILQKRIEEKVKTKHCYNGCPFENIKYCKECVIKKDAIEMATFALQNQWISVEEALPPLDDGMESVSIEVVVKNEYGKATCAWYSYITNTWHLSYGEIAGDDVIYSKITHWTPIPSLEGGEK